MYTQLSYDYEIRNIIYYSIKIIFSVPIKNVLYKGNISRCKTFVCCTVTPSRFPVNVYNMHTVQITFKLYGNRLLQCTSQNKTKVLSQKQKINYKLKIINPRKKSIYTTKSLLQTCLFDTLSDLWRYVKEKLGKLQGTLGFLEPGHGAKGKMRELHDDEDVAEMYILHKRKSDVLLWLYGSVDVEES